MPAYSLITDDFADKSLDKNLKIKTIEYAEIEDTFAEQSLSKNLKIQNRSADKIITDTFAEKNRAKNSINKPIVLLNEQIPEFDKNQISHKKVAVIDENDFLKIPVKIKNAFSTKQKVNEGDYLDFETISDISINNKLYPKGTIIKARVENVSMNDTVGVPADLTLGSFFLDEYPLQGEIKKKGANRMLWIYPAMCVCNVLCGIGLLLTLIRGGHAEIQPDETFELYYKM